MADTINDSLVKVTSELKEANQRSLEASKELGKFTASSESGASSIGSAVKDAVGLDKLESTIMSLPGMNVAKAIKDAIFKKRAQIRDQKNLADRLGITREQLIVQVKEQELLSAREDEQKILIEAAEKLGFGAEKIAELRGESAGPSGASSSEDAGEDRRAAAASLAVAEETNRLLREDDGDEEDSDKEGGLFNGILAPFKSFKAGLLAIPAIFTSIVAGITTFATALAPLALPIIAVVAGITAAIGFITGFMEGFAVGGIFGGLKEGMMKLFDWFIALPIKILKDIAVWALGALGMENLASALDAFPLVESLRKMFSFVVDLFVVPIGMVMSMVGDIFGGLFDIFMAPIKAFGTAIMSVFDAVDDIFGGIMMIFQGDIIGGLNAMWGGVKQLIMAPINFVVDTVKGIFGGLFDIVMAPFNALLGAIGFIFGPQSALGGVIEWFSATLGGIWETVTAPFTNVMAFLSDLFSFPTSFGDGLMKLIDIIYYPINLAVNFVKDLFGFGDPDVPFKLSQFLLDTVTDIFDWFKGLFNIDIGALVKSIPGAGRILSFFGYGDEESPDVEPTSSTTLPQENIAAVAGDMKDSAVSVVSGEKVDTKSAIDSARDSGLYNKNLLGKSKVDQSKIAEASDLQLQAILDDNDISRKNKEILEKELETRLTNTVLKDETNKVESELLKVKVFGKEYTKEELLQARKDGTVKRSIATAKIRELDMMEKKQQMDKSGVTSEKVMGQGQLSNNEINASLQFGVDGRLITNRFPKKQPLGMGSESITNSVANSATTNNLTGPSANATTSNLSYVPSRLDTFLNNSSSLDTTNNISSNSISTNDMPAGAVMQSDKAVLNTQKTVALREQGLDTQQAVAMAPMIFQSKSSSNVTNNVSTTKPMMMPVPVSNTGDGGFNFSNG